MAKDNKKNKTKPEDIYLHSRTAPIYKVTLDILYKLDDILTFLQKDRRHTIGQRTLDLTLEMLSCVSMAYNYEEKRVPQLKAYLVKYYQLSTLLKMLQDKGQLDYRGKNYYVDLIEPLGKAYAQASGWLDSTVNKSQSQ